MRAIVLARVIQEVLHDERGIARFPGDVQFRGQVRFHLQAERVGQRAQVIQPRLDEMRQVHRADLQPQTPGVHAREQQQVLDDAVASIV